ncbi:unnamed protein product [Clavelina lepadiformis]|uniref:Uncharacterized protein n=1 Tax=Clavelina lepadiformis TaxID=159417 RepID=A0ABP0GYR1_CLALP
MGDNNHSESLADIAMHYAILNVVQTINQTEVYAGGVKSPLTPKKVLNTWMSYTSPVASHHSALLQKLLKTDVSLTVYPTIPHTFLNQMSFLKLFVRADFVNETQISRTAYQLCKPNACNQISQKRSLMISSHMVQAGQNVLAIKDKIKTNQ